MHLAPPFGPHTLYIILSTAALAPGGGTTNQSSKVMTGFYYGNGAIFRQSNNTVYSVVCLSSLNSDYFDVSKCNHCVWFTILIYYPLKMYGV